jgi:hypothetical protein
MDSARDVVISARSDMETVTSLIRETDTLLANPTEQALKVRRLRTHHQETLLPLPSKQVRDEEADSFSLSNAFCKMKTLAKLTCACGHLQSRARLSRSQQ